MDDICQICCNDFNKSTRTPVSCKNQECEVLACKECVRTYLSTQSGDPHCMGCKIAFDDNFIVMNLNRAWCEKKYRQHRKGILLEQQMARMPETVEAAERFNEINTIAEKNSGINEQISDLRLTIRNLEIERRRNEIRIYNLNHHGNQEGKEQEKRKFIMACPDDDCRGYLSSGYKCEMCKLFTCSHCLKIIGHDKNNHNHVCNEDDVKTADFIKSTTKPCPGCGERIFKIEGCDQMWCTQCHVAFSWKTGMVDNGVVHNPHFYAHQRTGGGAPMRNPGEIACGGMPNWWTLRNTLRNRYYRQDSSCKQQYRKFIDDMTELHRTFAHIQHHELQRARQKIRDNTNHEPDRIRFLLKQISKADLANNVIRKDKLRRKYTELVHIYELIHVVSVDLFRWIENYIRNDAPPTQVGIEIIIMGAINEKVDELENLREYANEQLGTISVSYNQRVPQFRPRTWRIDTKKFSLKAAKAKAKADKSNQKIGSNEFTLTTSSV